MAAVTTNDLRKAIATLVSDDPAATQVLYDKATHWDQWDYNPEDQTPITPLNPPLENPALLAAVTALLGNDGDGEDVKRVYDRLVYWKQWYPDLAAARSAQDADEGAAAELALP